jgi:hypothetical protein
LKKFKKTLENYILILNIKSYKEVFQDISFIKKYLHL